MSVAAFLAGQFKGRIRWLRGLRRRPTERSELEHVLLSSHLLRDIGAPSQFLSRAEELRAGIIRDCEPR